MQSRHAEFFLALAEEAEPVFGGLEEAAWLKRLEDEHDNLRAALLGAGDKNGRLGLRLAAALWWFWSGRGYFGEGASVARGGAG